MISINQYIIEKLKIRKQSYKYHPQTKEELNEIIKERIINNGSDCNLNDIDVSKIKDMSYLFSKVHNSNGEIIQTFNGDISGWDVSGVEDMTGMFIGSKFNGDISDWDVSRVKVMDEMFRLSEFNGNISDWNVSNVESAYAMFYGCETFNQDLSNMKFIGIKDPANRAFMFKKCPLQHIENKHPQFNIKYVLR